MIKTFKKSFIKNASHTFKKSFIKNASHTFKKSFIKNASHTDIPRLLEPLKKGEADLVLGSRFKGEIKKGAMPWHHQYIGNPVLTWIFNLNKANKSNISDTHSGFRAFTRESYD